MNLAGLPLFMLGNLLAVCSASGRGGGVEEATMVRDTLPVEIKRALVMRSRETKVNKKRPACHTNGRLRPSST